MEELLKYEGLIYSVISKYSSRFDKDDLYQVGMMGLMNAYNHYDQKYGTKFSSFAYYYIVGEVNKYIRENSSLKISRDIIELKKEILKAKELMTQRLVRNPSNLELSLYLDVDENKIDDALLATDEVGSLEASMYEEKSYDDTSPTLLDLRSEIEKLSEEEKRLIMERYYHELTQMEAADILGMSQVQVSRKEGKILQKLKHNLVA